MTRSITSASGQWADVPLAELAKKTRSWGFDVTNRPSGSIIEGGSMSRREYLWKPLVKWAVIIGVLVVLRLVLPMVLSAAAGDVAKFVTSFLIFFLMFISVGVNFTSRALSHRVPQRLYRVVEHALIVCILGGVVCVFQPWEVSLYRIGWQALLVLFFLFIVWTHITPAGAELA